MWETVYTASKPLNPSEINQKLDEIDRLKKLKERYKTPVSHNLRISGVTENLNRTQDDRIL